MRECFPFCRGRPVGTPPRATWTDRTTSRATATRGSTCCTTMAGGSTSHTATACATTFVLNLDTKNTYYSNTTRGRTSRAAAAGETASSARPRPAVPPPRTTLAGRITFCVTTTRASIPCTCQGWQDDLPARLRPSGTATTRGSTTTTGAAPPLPLPPLPSPHLAASSTQTSPHTQSPAAIPASSSATAGPAAVWDRLVRGGERPARTRRELVLEAEVPGPPPLRDFVAPYKRGPKSPARHRAGAPLAFLPLLGDGEGRRASALALDGRLGPALGSGERRD